MIKELRCKNCHKVIGHYDSKTLRRIDQTEDFNSCDECGEEICFACSITYGGFNGCINCLKEHYPKGKDPKLSYPRPVLLSRAEVDVLDLIAQESKMDTWFLLECVQVPFYKTDSIICNPRPDGNANYYFRDMETPFLRRKSFKNALFQLFEGMEGEDEEDERGYKFYGLTKKEISVFEYLLMRFKIIYSKEGK